MVLGAVAGVALGVAIAYTTWIVDVDAIDPRRIIALGWYLAPVLTSLLIVVGATIPNRAKDHILRRPNKSGHWPTIVFAALRMLDPVLVGWLLRPTIMTSTTNGMEAARGTLLVVLVAVGALRHAFWVTRINLNEWNWELAFIVAAFNNWFDWTHAKCLLKRLAESEGSSGNSNGTDVPATTWFGVGLFIIGGFLETYSEVQRRKFKDNPLNKGKLYTGGLFAYARHINYFGYILWRTGLGFVSGPPFTLSYGLYHAVDFYVRAIPLLQNHMKSKYGDQWTEYTKQTKSVLVPGIL